MNRLKMGAIAMALAAPAGAQQLDVQIRESAGDGQAASCYSATVVGLDPNGDGFLAIRSGPGSNYRKIGELYNGDVVLVFEGRGRWFGILKQDARNARPDTCANNGPARRLNGRPKGWVHGNWLRGLAG